MIIKLFGWQVNYEKNAKKRIQRVKLRLRTLPTDAIHPMTTHQLKALITPNAARILKIDMLDELFWYKEIQSHYFGFPRVVNFLEPDFINIDVLGDYLPKIGTVVTGDMQTLGMQHGAEGVMFCQIYSYGDL